MSSRVTPSGIVCFLLVAMFLAAPGSCGRSPEESPSADTPTRTPLAWLQDLDKARSIAMYQEKPLLVVFRCEP